MKAIIKNDLMGLGNEGKIVDLIVEIPRGSGISFFEKGSNVRHTYVVRKVWLVNGISRMQNGYNETRDVSIVYGGYTGSDIVSDDEIEILEEE